MNLTGTKLLYPVFLSLFLLLSCSQGSYDNGKNSKKPYSIFLGEFSTEEKVETFRLSLNTVLQKDLRIEKIYERNFKIYFGRYASSFEAGEAAFELFTNSLIGKNYKITRDGVAVLDAYANVLFVSKYLDRASVFSYNLLTKQTEVEWSNPLLKVAALNYTPDHTNAFVCAAAGFGQRGKMLYINNAELFLMRREEEETLDLKSLGDGVQLYTYWENQDTFKVNFSSIDTLVSRIVDQKIYAFDLNGKEGKTRERKFDLLKNGYPLPPNRTTPNISPNKRFRFREVYSQGESYIYIRDFDEKSEQLCATIKGKIFDYRWSEAGNYLFIVTDNKESYGTAGEQHFNELIILNTDEKRVVRIFAGFNYENLLVHGKLLFYDERSDKSAFIQIYDYRHDKIINTITMYGGCGLNNLPQ